MPKQTATITMEKGGTIKIEFFPEDAPKTVPGMVVATHLLYPGDDRHRMWLEDVALVRADGAEPFFTWGFDPIPSVP